MYPQMHNIFGKKIVTGYQTKFKWKEKLMILNVHTGIKSTVVKFLKHKYVQYPSCGGGFCGICLKTAYGGAECSLWYFHCCDDAGFTAFSSRLWVECCLIAEKKRWLDSDEFTYWCCDLATHVGPWLVFESNPPDDDQWSSEEDGTIRVADLLLTLLLRLFLLPAIWSLDFLFCMLLLLLVFLLGVSLGVLKTKNISIFHLYFKVVYLLPCSTRHKKIRSDFRLTPRIYSDGLGIWTWDYALSGWGGGGTPNTPTHDPPFGWDEAWNGGNILGVGF